MDKQLTDKAIKFKGSDYVQVKDRVLFLANEYEWRYSIQTEYQFFPENKMWVVKATLTIWDKDHEEFSIFNWLAQEIENSSFINKTSALENAETSAIGRACAMAWIWVIDSIASIDEINKANNRSMNIEKEKADLPFKEEWNPEPEWFVKAKQATKFMQDCLDEKDFITKIKARVKEIWTTMTKQQETDLKICYKNAKAMEKIDLPFPED